MDNEGLVLLGFVPFLGFDCVMHLPLMLASNNWSAAKHATEKGG